ncbi:MAG: glycoside hydrolase family 3 C-terminal domain-containing protein [Oscillospiraceae bacterium]|nr:glycoside hydrolase family 3 C-terminal domain-containing protein [Oscillospiraceae bacterium]
MSKVYKNALRKSLCFLLSVVMLFSIVSTIAPSAVATEYLPAPLSSNLPAANASNAEWMAIPLATNPLDLNVDPWATNRVIDPAARAVWMDPDRPIEVRVRALLSQMTLDELVGQTTQLTHANLTTAPNVHLVGSNSRVSNSFLGGFLFAGGGVPAAAFGGNTTLGWLNFYNIVQNEAVNRTPLGIPIFAHIDAVHGTAHAPGTTVFPHNIGLGAAYMGDFITQGYDPFDMTDGATWTPRGSLAVARDIGRATSFEMAALGYHFTFSPCIPLALDMRWGRTSEGFGQNPHFEGIVAGAVVEGYQGGQAPTNHAMLDTGVSETYNPFYFLAGPYAMGSTMKHYLGEGITVNGANQGQTWIHELLPGHPDFDGTSWPIARTRAADGRPTSGAGGQGTFDPQGVFDLNFMSREDWWANDDIRDIIEAYRHLIESGARSIMPTFNSINGLRVHQLQSVTDIITRPVGDTTSALPWSTDVDSGETLGFTGFLVGDFNGHTNGTFAPTGAALTASANLFYPTSQQNADGRNFLGAFNHNGSAITTAQFRNGLVINAGMDLMMVVGHHEGREVTGTGDFNTTSTSWFNTQVMNVLAGRVPLARLYDANARILRVKFELGLFEDPFRNLGVDVAEMATLAEASAGGVLTSQTWQNNAAYMALLNAASTESNLRLRAGGALLDDLGLQSDNDSLPELARQAARESLVLLKNSADVDLGVDAAASATIMEQLVDVDPANILVAGRFANRIGWQLGDWNRTWQGETNPMWSTTTITLPGAPGITPIAPPPGIVAPGAGINEVVGHYVGSNLLEGMRAVLGAGFDPVAQFSEFGLLLPNMSPADVDVIILAVGETPYSEGQGDAPPEGTMGNNNANSRGHATNLQLHPEDHVILRQVQAAYPGVPIVMVGYFGRPMIMENIIDDVDAFICAWWPGTEGGHAVAEMLFTDEYEFIARTAFPWAWYAEWIGRYTIADLDKNLWNVGAGLNRNQSSNALTPNTFDRPARQTDPIVVNLADGGIIDGFIYTHNAWTNERVYRQPVFDRDGYLSSARIRTGGNLNHGGAASPVIGVTTMANPLTYFAGEMAWVEYLVDVQNAGDYLISFTTNTRTGPAALDAVRLFTKAADADRTESGNLLATFTVAASITPQIVTLNAGLQVLRIEIDPTATNLDIDAIELSNAAGHFDLRVDRETFAAGDTRMVPDYNAVLVVSSVSAQEGDTASLVMTEGGNVSTVVEAPFKLVDDMWVATLYLPDAGVAQTVTTGAVANHRTYQILASRGTTSLNSIPVTVLAWAQDIFEMRIEGRSNQIHGMFNHDIAVAPGANSGTIGGALVGGLQISPIGVREALITGFQTDDLDLIGNPIVFVNGVRFPGLFGNTEFSFTAFWQTPTVRYTVDVVNGMKAPDIANHLPGTQVTLTAAVEAFDEWVIYPSTVQFVAGSTATSNPTTFIMPTANVTATTGTLPTEATFDLVVDVLEWGSAVTAVVIDMGEVINQAALADLVGDIDVNALVRHPGTGATFFDGERVIENVWLSATSDIEHTLIRRDTVRASTYNGAATGQYVVVELRYGFNNTAGQVNGSEASRWLGGGTMPAGNRNHWLDKDYTVIVDGTTFDFANVIRPIYDDFELVNSVGAFSGQYYRMFTPDGATEPLPLVLWSHGAGETLGANANANNEGSQLFANMGGVGWVLNAPEDAIILAPQRHAAGAGAAMDWAPYSRAGVMALVRHLIAEGLVDANRIYVSGPSAGAAESHNFMLEFPSYIAGALVICVAGTQITTANAPIVSHIPTWYIQAQEFTGGGGHTHANATVNSYEAMAAAGASDVRLTVYARVFGTELPNPWYDGNDHAQPAFMWRDGRFYPDNHWSWVTALNNTEIVPNSDPVRDQLSIINRIENAQYGDRFMDWLFDQQRQEAGPLNYRMVVEGFDWGPGVTRLIISLDESVTLEDVDYTDFEVNVLKQGFGANPTTGSRVITNAFVSDADGNPVTGSGSFITLEMAVHPSWAIANPFHFQFSPMGNMWANPFAHTITWDGDEFEGNRIGKIMPITDEFDLDGEFTHGAVTLQYATFTPPEAANSDRPVIIWLHGGGEGSLNNTVGTEIAILGNRVTQLAAPEIQDIMGGAHVLVPQAPGMWLGGAGLAGSNFETALMALIVEYLEYTPGIDLDRVYIGGCSNGGFITMRALFLRPDLFAAAFPICLQYNEGWMTEERLESIAHIPTWLIHDVRDTTLNAVHSIRMYERMNAAGAVDARLTLTDGIYTIIDGAPVYHSAHWSWIPVLNNTIDSVTTDYTGLNRLANGNVVVANPGTFVNTPADITIFEWLAAQSRQGPTPIEPEIFTDTRPNALANLLDRYDHVVLATRGNLGIFEQHSEFVIPADTTLTVETALNVHRNAEVIVEGTLIISEAGRLNLQQNGTVTIAYGGRLIVHGWVETVSAPETRFTNAGTITITETGRFNIRENVYYCLEVCGTVVNYGRLNVHRNARTLESCT